MQDFVNIQPTKANDMDHPLPDQSYNQTFHEHPLRAQVNPNSTDRHQHSPSSWHEST
jgi:hypothetical protein